MRPRDAPEIERISLSLSLSLSFSREEGAFLGWIRHSGERARIGV